MDYVGYVRKLEQVLVQAVHSLGIETKTIPGLTGLWVDRQQNPTPAKLAAIGVKVDARGISRHGFALNVNPNMSHWGGIVACGLAGYGVTSLEELLQPCPEMARVRLTVLQAFMRVFAVEIKMV